MFNYIYRRWFPVFLMMAIIFALSSIPSNEVPHFDWLDFVIKKGAHMVGYGLLALAYLCALNENIAGKQSDTRRYRTYALAWLLTVLYAITDEIHQMYVSGRHASMVDVGIDALGAALILMVLLVARGRYENIPKETDIR